MGLRPWGTDASDAEALASAWVEPSVARWTAVPAEHGVEAARRWIEGEGIRRESGRAVDLAVIVAGQPQEVLGEVGLVLVDAERRWAEVGYWLTPEARGAGRATAALVQFTDWALRDLGLRRLFARTGPANPASAAVAERAGYDMAGTIEGGIEVWVRDAGS